MLYNFPIVPLLIENVMWEAPLAYQNGFANHSATYSERFVMGIKNQGTIYVLPAFKLCILYHHIMPLLRSVL